MKEIEKQRLLEEERKFEEKFERGKMEIQKALEDEKNKQKDESYYLKGKLTRKKPLFIATMKH